MAIKFQMEMHQILLNKLPISCCFLGLANTAGIFVNVCPRVPQDGFLEVGTLGQRRLTYCQTALQKRHPSFCSR